MRLKLPPWIQSLAPAVRSAPRPWRKMTIAFAPPFRIEGPDTFYRFHTAAMTGQAITLAAGLLFFVRDMRSGWPFLLAPLSFGLNEAIRIFLTGRGLIDPLTQAVGGMSQALTFVGTFALLLAFLVGTALPTARTRQLARA